MKTTLLFPLLPLLCAAALALPASAGVVQTQGAGSATPAATHLTYTADFEANAALASPWSESGLLFSQVGGLAADNGGCGYAGELCLAYPGQVYSEAFSGNFFATAGYNAYLSIRSAGADLGGIEFAVDSGYATIHLMWQTWLDGVLTGTGKANLGAQGIGGIVGLSDANGFDEVRLYTFDSASDSSGYSTPQIDSVRAFVVPEPGSLALAALAGLVMAAGRRRRAG